MGTMSPRRITKLALRRLGFRVFVSGVHDTQPPANLFFSRRLCFSGRENVHGHTNHMDAT
jgi:hypothetical protein